MIINSIRYPQAPQQQPPLRSPPPAIKISPAALRASELPYGAILATAPLPMDVTQSQPVPLFDATAAFEAIAAHHAQHVLERMEAEQQLLDSLNPQGSVAQGGAHPRAYPSNALPLHNIEVGSSEGYTAEQIPAPYPDLTLNLNELREMSVLPRKRGLDNASQGRAMKGGQQ